MSNTTEPAPDSFKRRAVIFRLVLCLTTLILFGCSWPLWIDAGTSFPRVPFVLGLPEPAWLNLAFAIITVVSLVSGMIRPSLLLAGLPALIYLIAGDQHRFQPWVYQYLIMALALSTLSSATALSVCRLFLVALYIYSGLSKLDVTFAREIGLTFLIELTRPLNLHPSEWPDLVRSTATWCLPLGEIGVGVCLAIRLTRTYGILAAVVMHATLIGILGPWALDHSTIVLLWNGSLILQVVLLFAKTPPKSLVTMLGDVHKLQFPVLCVIISALVLPLFERRGWWDSWPSFALYASHAERVYIKLHEADLAAYPERVQQSLVHAEPGDPWRIIDLTSWSRAERGTPPYPQARAAVGVAEALVNIPDITYPVRVVAWSRADRFSGQRVRVEATGQNAIHELTETFVINAHPKLQGP